MDEQKLTEILEELNIEALKKGYIRNFKVISGSMRYIFNIGDIIFVKNIPTKLIKINDIVVFKRSEKFITHRIIKKKIKNGEIFFRTRGDSNLKPDSFFLREDEILGKVCGIKKGEKYINIESTIGKIYSIFMMLSSRFILYLMIFLKAITHVFYDLKVLLIPEKNYLKDFKLNWHSYNESIDFNKWEKNLNVAYNLLDRYFLNDSPTAEIDFGYGFSESTMFLLRKGIKVETINIENLNRGNNFKQVILADIFNLIPTRRKRIEFLKKINKDMAPDGLLAILGVKKCFFSLLNFYLDCKWRFLKFMLKNLPEKGDRLKRGKFQYHTFSKKELFSEINKAGFVFAEMKERNGIFNLIVRKI